MGQRADDAAGEQERGGLGGLGAQDGWGDQEKQLDEAL
jgi:hypothetical protein